MMDKLCNKLLAYACTACMFFAISDAEAGGKRGGGFSAPQQREASGRRGLFARREEKRQAKLESIEARIGTERFEKRQRFANNLAAALEGAAGGLEAASSAYPTTPSWAIGAQTTQPYGSYQRAYNAAERSSFNLNYSRNPNHAPVTSSR